MSREKELTIKLLEAKIERITGKNVVYESKKKASVTNLKEAHSKVARIFKKLEEGRKLTKEETEIVEGLGQFFVGKDFVGKDPQFEARKQAFEKSLANFEAQVNAAIQKNPKAANLIMFNKQGLIKSATENNFLGTILNQKSPSDGKMYITYKPGQAAASKIATGLNQDPLSKNVSN
jgi:uncharacterized protein YbbK (DUF523 family)